MKRWMGILALLFSVSASADLYTVSTKDSDIVFKVKKFKIKTVTGRFHDFSGTIDYDSSRKILNSAAGIVTVASLETEDLIPGDHKFRDSHLRGADFFDASNFPQILFATKQSKMITDMNAIEVEGQMNIKSNVQPVRFKVTEVREVKDVFGRTTEATFKASATIKRQDFGLLYSRMVDGVGMVGDDVEIEMTLKAFRN